MIFWGKCWIELDPVIKFSAPGFPVWQNGFGRRYPFLLVLLFGTDVFGISALARPRLPWYPVTRFDGTTASMWAPRIAVANRFPRLQTLTMPSLNRYLCSTYSHFHIQHKVDMNYRSVSYGQLDPRKNPIFPKHGRHPGAKPRQLKLESDADVTAARLQGPLPQPVV